MKEVLKEIFQLPPIRLEHIVSLRDLERIHVSCEFRPNGLCDLNFGYMAWWFYRNRCFRELAQRTGLSRLPQKLRAERELQICKIAGAFAGSRKAYETRTRKACYAKMIAALREVLPGLTTETVELLAGRVLSHCRRGQMTVWGGVQFKVSWDIETLREFLSYRRHDLPADTINCVADITSHVLRHLDTLPLTCRRNVKNYVLQHRYFCRDYDMPDRLKALDCSFKYTAGAYAFRKARYIALALRAPETFFKRAGQKIRMRQYAAWLRDQRDHFEDIYDSLGNIAEPDSRFSSWADLEGHSRDWHARQITAARHGMRNVGYKPFEIAPEIPRSLSLRGYLFSLLASPEQMADESVRMHHCIHSYADDVRAGSYLAYKLEGNGERATLGLSKGDKSWGFDQVRRKRNATVPEEVWQACMEFTKSLNDRIRSSRREKGAA
jgi:hypothetical protein